ncbi:DUF58 domain-containing protein [Chromobacterium sphagni]|uniref:Uncharacterized protein n=1 Tax=Chromobacterium sphagni TaxID=1903179 RepID=A0A1S1X0Q2_9NEIS|nr:DUF58 domain-containing protein [Chromobacterium sphagni]OHX12985.1 hypothetical protein BI347_05255 [Chromobacterium sphagni]OHX19254.1 hypothetical protein BI344_08995 [Chromobacterium sphagni]
MSRFRERLQRWLLARLPLEERCELSQRRIYLLPTRFGLLLLAVGLAVWVGALNYQVSLAYALAFWIVSLVLVAVLMAYRQLSGLRLRAEPGAAVFAGDPACFRLVLENPSALQRQLQVHLQGDDRRLPCGLAGQGSGSVELTLPTSGRGWLALPACVVASEAPFGLIRAWAVLRLQSRLLVYPALLPDAARGGSEGDGGSGGRSRPGGDDFSHLDAYRHGDTPRQIAWKVLARRDVLTSKRFASESGGDLTLIRWSDYGAEADAERRLSRMAWRVEQCERRQQRYRLSLPDDEIGPQPRQREQALSALALFGGRP